MDIWQKRRFFDLWSIPHFLFGVLAALSPFVINISKEESFLFMIVIALLWEFYEFLVGIKETVWNNITDLVLPIISFYLTNKILINIEVGNIEGKVFFGAILLVYIFTNVSGWLAYRNRVRGFMH